MERTRSSLSDPMNTEMYLRKEDNQSELDKEDEAPALTLSYAQANQAF